MDNDIIIIEDDKPKPKPKGPKARRLVIDVANLDAGKLLRAVEQLAEHAGGLDRLQRMIDFLREWA